VPVLVWAPDSQRVTFNRAGDDPAKPLSTRIVWTKADGSDTQELELVRSDGLVSPSSWSSDGKALAYQSSIQTNRDLWIFEPGGNPRERAFVATPAEERAPVFSPDGESIAYVSNESGTNEIYVKRYPGPGGRVTISNGGGNEPVWSRDGRELFYRVGNAMMAVSVVAGPPPSFGQPHELFQGQYLGDYSGAAAYPYYDVARDGRFLMVQRPASATKKVVFVQHWVEELKRLVPTK
jgi:Tol biopolymer transport system component